MKKIVFINQASGYLTIDIVNEFAEKFDKVGLISEPIRIQDTDLDSRVEWSRIIKKSRKSNLIRFIRWIIATIQIFILLLTKYRKYEIFYFSVPPFAYFCSLIIHRRFTILMWDIYPDALSSVGINENNLIWKIWIKINRLLFKKAYRLYTIGFGLSSIMGKYVAMEKILIIPLWSGFKNITPIEKDRNPFIIEHGLQNKFIVQYSGNIGKMHNIDSLIEVAKLTREDTEIQYLIIGRGTKYIPLQENISNNKLNNCLILPFQPDNIIKYSLAAADISVVLIEDGASGVMIPSKIYNLLAVGSPILCISHKSSEVNSLIEEHGVGENFGKHDIGGIANFIVKLKNDKDLRLEFQKKSLIASKKFTSDNAKQFYSSYINKYI